MGKRISDEDYFDEIISSDNKIKMIKIYDRIDNLCSLNLIEDVERKKRYLEETRISLTRIADFDSRLRTKLDNAIKCVRI